MRGQSSSVKSFVFSRWMRVRVDDIDDSGGEKYATVAVLGKFSWELISGVYDIRRLVREQDPLGCSELDC